MGLASTEIVVADCCKLIVITHGQTKKIDRRRNKRKSLRAVILWPSLHPSTRGVFPQEGEVSAEQPAAMIQRPGKNEVQGMWCSCKFLCCSSRDIIRRLQSPGGINSPQGRLHHTMLNVYNRACFALWPSSNRRSPAFRSIF